MTTAPRISDAGKRHAILSARARRLARPRQDAKPVASTLCLLCEVGGSLYGLPLEKLARVTPFRRAAPIPSGNPALLGAIAHGGVFYHVFDLARLLGGAGEREGGHVLLLRGVAPATGLRVDRALGVVNLVELGAEATSQMGASHPAVKTFARPLEAAASGERTVALLDVDMLASVDGRGDQIDRRK